MYRATTGQVIEVVRILHDAMDLARHIPPETRSAAEDVAPQPPRHAVTRPEDLWLLGDHRLVCADPRNADDFGRLMEGALAPAAFCAAPGMLARSTVDRGRTEPPGSASDSGEASPEQYREYLLEALGNGAHVSSEGAIHFVCMYWRRISDLIEVGRKLYGEMLNLVVWDKTSAGPEWPYRSQHQPIGVFRVGRQPRQNDTEFMRFGRNRSDVWTYPAARTMGKNRAPAPAADPPAYRSRSSPTRCSIAPRRGRSLSINLRDQARQFSRRRRSPEEPMPSSARRASSMSPSSDGNA